MSLWSTGDAAEAWKFNKNANTGLEANLGSPTVAGEKYFCTDTGKEYVSSNGVDWDYYIQWSAVV
jgi:hypothetical protein